MSIPQRLGALAGLAVVAALVGPRSRAHDGPEEGPRAVAPVDAHRPSAIPDRVILTFVGDPARSLGVTWRTDTTVVQGRAQIAKADANPKFVENSRDILATTTPITTDLGAAHCHSVVFTDLEPATLYAYRVGDGANWSEWFHARTASTGPEPFAFIYFGDAQNSLKSLWSRVIRGAYADAPKARFIVHAGDLVNRGHSDADWGEWFYSGGWVNGMVPSVPTPGNHEYAKTSDAPDAKRTLTAHWRAQFTLPENGPEGLEESVYYLDYQGARIISLNSNEQQERQAEWLQSVLGANNPNRWTIVTFHHPIFSTARDRDNASLRRLWQPIFDAAKVDLVLQGHDHSYGRSGLMVSSENVATGASLRSPEAGTVYVVSVSGPKLYNLNLKSDWMRRRAEDTQLYQIITVAGDTLRYEARTAVGELYDAFELRRRPGQANELIEHVPPTPERLRAVSEGAAHR